MTSFSKEDEYDYFDKVHITSHSGIVQDYDIDELKFESFQQNPLKDAILEDGVNKFNNTEFCRVFKYLEREAYKVMPSLKLGGQNGFQDTVGPFVLKNEIQLVDRNNENIRVIMHKISCKDDKVSGVLQMYPVTIKPHVVARRTGLSTLTLLVNGVWNSSTGLLSMTGCLGPDLVKCNSGVLLYFPKSFSTKQRSAVYGSIFSLTNATKPFHPVFIGLEMLYPGLYDLGSYGRDYLSYNYSKNDLAVELKERIQEPRLITYIKNLLFTYPSVFDKKDGIFNISSRLLDDLKIDTFSSFETFVNIEVLSLGPLFRTNDTSFFEVSNDEFLNVSLNLLITEDPKKVREPSYRHVKKLYLEGVYDLHVGKMYLIGCRKVDFDHVNLERGLDCLIEVTIQYSPVNTRWLINPTAKISIASQRDQTDVYQFNTIRLQTFMIHDIDHKKNVIFRKIFEGYFRIFLLSMYIANISILILNMKKSKDSVPYISILTLTMWIIGYGIDLIHRKEIMIKSSETPHYVSRPYDLESYKGYLKNLDYFARFLVLVTMLQMARIAQMVMKARKLLSQQGESTPSEKKVILVTFGVCICYFIVMIALCGFDLYQHDVTFTKDYNMASFVREVWYSIPDFQSYMLIPQIICLRIWKPRFLGPIFGHFVLRQWLILTIQFAYNSVRDPVTYPV
ncbi:uncharacterized protein [Rutidosis leptorrhynchoides]|uniref:uncharacterized protein n=1 Tax=Rutidosis leptorrhynchoides TaxID=125765 RepID=UPI003A994452